MLKIRKVLVGGLVLSGAALLAAAGARASGAGEPARTLAVSQVQKVDERLTSPEYDQLALADVTISDTKVKVTNSSPVPMP